MTDGRLDPIHEEMIAALYGELPPHREEALMERLRSDETLRREWEELQEIHRVLRVAVRPATQGDRAGRVLARLRSLVTPARAWAAAAALLLALLAAGLRVDRTPGGLVLHFGGAPPAPEVDYVTRDDLDAYTMQVFRGVAAMLEEARARDRATLAYMLQGLSEDLRQNQQRDYEALQAEIQQVGLWLLGQSEVFSGRPGSEVSAGD
jgi:hypothetical protein